MRVGQTRTGSAQRGGRAVRLALAGLLATVAGADATAPASASPVAPAGDPVARVVGGRPARADQFPWMVRLSTGCGGALVADRVVLTAAHCVGSTGHTRRIRIIAGATDLRSPDAIKVRSRYVLRAPRFHNPIRGDDWALIQLAQRLDLPVLQWTRSTRYDHGMFTAMGWGSTREDGYQQRVLRKVHLPFVSDRKCGSTYRKIGFPFVKREMICAGDLDKGGIDTCQGDSGGPLVRRNHSGAWRQVGIVSWGFGCGRPGYPGIYTQVSTFTRDIADGVRRLS